MAADGQGFHQGELLEGQAARRVEFAGRQLEKRAQAVSRAQILGFLRLSTEPGFLKSRDDEVPSENFAGARRHLFF